MFLLGTEKSKHTLPLTNYGTVNTTLFRITCIFSNTLLLHNCKDKNTVSNLLILGQLVKFFVQREISKHQLNIVRRHYNQPCFCSYFCSPPTRREQTDSSRQAKGAPVHNMKLKFSCILADTMHITYIRNLLHFKQNQFVLRHSS